MALSMMGLFYIGLYGRCGVDGVLYPHEGLHTVLWQVETPSQKP